MRESGNSIGRPDPNGTEIHGRKMPVRVRAVNIFVKVHSITARRTSGHFILGINDIEFPRMTGLTSIIFRFLLICHDNFKFQRL